MMRSNERLTQTPSSRSAVSASSAASVCTKQSIVAKRRLDHPRALGLRAQAHGAAAGSATSSDARFSNASVVMIAAAKSASPSAAQLRRGAGEARDDALARRAGRR